MHIIANPNALRWGQYALGRGHGVIYHKEPSSRNIINNCVFYSTNIQSKPLKAAPLWFRLVYIKVDMRAEP